MDMSSDMNTILLLVFAFIWILSLVLDYVLTQRDLKKMNNVNQESFQKYAKFYGDVVPSDADYNTKINKILDCILNKKMDDIKEIAKISYCTQPECVLKIRYLKNKRMIGDYYIDTVNLKLYPCSKEDEKLIEKYKGCIYSKHLSIQEIATIMYQNDPRNGTVEEYIDKVYNDLKYLDDKNLINGVKLIDVDKKIIYYSTEKKKETNYVTVHCPNCGALNDIDVGNKTRCSYCNTIMFVDENNDENRMNV